MVQPLPISNFEWSEERDVNVLLEKYAENETNGCIVKCDLEYPAHLHDDHNDYPLAPERKLVTQDMLSPYAANLQHQLGINKDVCEKLVPNLQDKEGYVVDIRNLKFYTDPGLDPGLDRGLDPGLDSGHDLDPGLAPDPEPDPDPCPDPPSHTMFLANTALMRASRHTVRRCGVQTHHTVILYYYSTMVNAIERSTYSVQSQSWDLMAAHWQHIGSTLRLLSR